MIVIYYFFPHRFAQFQYFKMEENYQETSDHDSDSVLSENTFNDEISSVELNESDAYSSEEAFFLAVKTYAKQQGFQVHLTKIKKNAMGQICQRTIVCSREGSPKNGSCKRNCTSQRCNCKFKVRASLNSNNELWYIIFTYLEHNH